jgi:ABC-2 type transport system permease protein
MSAVNTASPPIRNPAARRPNARFLRSELQLIFGRRRNLAGLAALAVVPVVLALAVRASNGEAGEAGGPEFVALITGNGFYVALAALALELGLFLPIAVAAISVDAIAGEANVGTLRYLLAVPVARTRMLAVKYTAVVIFAVVAATLVAASGLVVGLALFGGGPVTLLSGSQVGFGEGLARLAGILAYLTVCLSALGAVGLFASTLTEQPIGGGIAVVMLTVGSFILDSIPQIAWLHPYLLTHWWAAFGDLMRDPVAWDGIRSGLISAGAYIVIFLSAAWARFSGRDVTS